MRSDFIIYSTYTIKWEVNQDQVVCQKTSKIQTLHVTVYFHTPLEEISRSATPSFDFSMPCIRLKLIPLVYTFSDEFSTYICGSKYTYWWELKQESRLKVLCCFCVEKHKTLLILCVSDIIILQLHKEKFLFHRKYSLEINGKVPAGFSRPGFLPESDLLIHCISFVPG